MWEMRSNTLCLPGFGAGSPNCKISLSSIIVYRFKILSLASRRRDAAGCWFYGAGEVVKRTAFKG